MTPTATLHFDTTKIDDAVIYYTKVADYCEHFGNRGTQAAAQLKTEIEACKKDAANPLFAGVKDMMLQNIKVWEGMLAAMGSFNAPAKEAQQIADKLLKAQAELKKKPSDKKTMDNFSACVKEAAAVCGKLRTTAQTFKQKLPNPYGGVDSMRAFDIIVDTLQKYIDLAMPKLAPPRPLQGPPGRH